MKKSLRYIVCLLAVVPMLQGCFKDVVNYTDYRICVYDQSQSNGEFIHSPELESYAFYVDTTEWTVKSYEDAVARRITNKLTGETKTTPDAEGTFAAEEEYQVTVRLESEISMLVIVNPTLQLYAYRKYKLPENLPVVDTKLYMASWRPTHPASGWLIKNEFYIPPTNEPTTPPADDNEGNEGDEDDNGEGGEDGEDNPPADDGDGDTPTDGDGDTPTEDDGDTPTEDDGDTPTEDDNNDENQKK